MLKSKIVTLGAAAVMGVTSLGVPQFIAHADTTKSGDTVVSYTGTAPQPKDWGISVPATINLSSKGMSGGYEFDYGIGKLEIVNSDGTPFTDPSSNHIFDISGTAAYVHNGYVLMPEDSSTDKLNSNVYLYNEITEQGASEPTGVTDRLVGSQAGTGNFAHINFNTSANTPLIRYITFGVGSKSASTLKGPASNTISWTASETTPATTPAQN